MVATQPLVIFGAGGFGREVLQIVHSQNRVTPTWDFRGFLVDPEYPAPDVVQGFPVLGGSEWLRDNLDVKVAIAVGSSAARRNVAKAVGSYGTHRFVTLIHPLAWLGENVRCGEGVIICAGSLLTTDISIGAHVIVNLDCTVGHDSVIGAFATLSPGAHLSGNVRLGDGVEVGTGASFLPGITIGDGTAIGAGACVTKHFGDNLVIVGVPATVLHQRASGWHPIEGQSE